MRMIVDVLSTNVKARHARKICKGAEAVDILVPSHRLGDEIAEELSRHGLDAQVFRGRSAHVGPERDRPTMCDNLEQVEMAIKCHATVSTSCCQEQGTDMQVL